MRSVELALRRHAESEQPLIEVLGAGESPGFSYSKREITRAARHLADRLDAVRREADGRLRVGVLCGDTAELVTTGLALLAVRATADPVPPTAPPGTVAALLGETDVVVADALGRERLGTWGAEQVLPAGVRVIGADIGAMTGAGRPYTLSASGDDRMPGAVAAPDRGSSGAGAVIRVRAVGALLEALRDHVPAAALTRCLVAAPMVLSSRQMAMLLLVVLHGGRLILPPPGPLRGSTGSAGSAGEVPGWLRDARPTALAATPMLVAAVAAAARTARTAGEPVAPAVFGTVHAPLLWCSEPLRAEVVRELDDLGIPVHTARTPATRPTVLPRARAARPADAADPWPTLPRADPDAAGTGGQPPVRNRTGPGEEGSAAPAANTRPARSGIDDPAVRTALASLRTAETGDTAFPEIGWLLYSLVRSLRPATVLECGGSFGSALLHLAAALRDNGAGGAVGCAPNGYWADRVRRVLALAGLADWAEVRDDCVCGMPRDAPRPVDLILLSGWQEELLLSLRALEPRMRPGTVVVAGSGSLPADYLEQVRGSDDYTSVSLSIGEGVEVSHRLRAATRPAAPPPTGSGPEYIPTP